MAENKPLRLPPAHGASPRAGLEDQGAPTRLGEPASSLNEMQSQDLKMIQWYKLANEAAMKAALVKHKRFKEVPRYNPAAERVRQRSKWMEQVIIEEQNKPLELDADSFTKMMTMDVSERQKQYEKAVERHSKIVQMIADFKAKEERKLAYRRFLAEQEMQRSQGFSSGGLQGLFDKGETPEVGYSAAAVETLERLEALEQRVAAIVRDYQSTVKNAITVDLSKANESLGVAPIHAKDPVTLAAEQVTFIKRRTEPHLNQPSLVFYTAKVVPPSEERKEAVSLRQSFVAQDISPQVIMHMQEMEAVRAAQLDKSRDSLRPNRSKASDVRSISPISRVQASTEHSADLLERRLRREELQQDELRQQERVDEVIKDWLRGRSRRNLKRQKKMRDIMRADRRFLSKLQVTKEAKAQSAAGGNSGAAGVNAAGGGNNGGGGGGGAGGGGSLGQQGGGGGGGGGGGTGGGRGGGSRGGGGGGAGGAGDDLLEGLLPTAGMAALTTDDIDRRLDVLMQQQKQMETWRPVVRARR